MRTLFLLTTALVAAPALAQTTTVPTDHHEQASSDIVVTAPFQRTQADLLAGTSVLTGAELTREIRPTIGETLIRQPGVSATSFGPNASRPVLRGLQGERVRVLTDGIGSFDVSNTSVDHAVAINPLTADRIEVLRGPSALLFGSSAIGGVVNVIDARIPRRVPADVHADAILTYGTAANERSASGTLDLPVGDKIVFHVDGSYTKTGDLRTGGFILSAPLRAQAAASPDAGVRSLATLRGDLPNTAAETRTGALGAAVVTGGGNFGFSVSRYESVYGVPVRFSLDPMVEAERVRLDVAQTRVDLRAEVPTGGSFLDRIRFRGGGADYKHAELGADGTVGTRFFSQGLEGRLELVQANRGGWEGASGLQYLVRTVRIEGDEKFLPRNESRQFGLFTLQSFDLGPVRLEAGARYERAVAEAQPDADLGNGFVSRQFDALSGSVGGNVELLPNVRLGLNLTHSERAPAAEELFANGPHAGTQAFEVGSVDFRKERSNGAELTVRVASPGLTLSGSAYYNRFRNFIYQVDTGVTADDLPVFQFLQAPAEQYGFELEAAARLAEIGGFTLNLDGVGDYTRATVTGVGPEPRIPPLRLLGGIEAKSDRFDTRLEVEHSFAQDRVTGFETRTPGFTLVNLSAAFRPFGRDRNASLSLSANNIFDVEARRHASFLKDFAPLPGRDLRATLRIGI